MGNQILTDYEGRKIRLTEERWQNILSHPEMKDLSQLIPKTLSKPQIVRQSNTDETIYLYYCYQTQTIVGEKWLCVVVKILDNEAFIITPYLTNRLKKGKQICLTQ